MHFSIHEADTAYVRRTATRDPLASCVWPAAVHTAASQGLLSDVPRLCLNAGRRMFVPLGRPARVAGEVVFIILGAWDPGWK